MNNKVWVYILIIVVISSLFPSIIIAKADEGEGGVPDIEYSLQDAPFPGTYEKFTESRWQAFINRAESLGHDTIFQLTSYTVHYENGGAKNFTFDEPIFFSTDWNADGVGTVTEIIDERNTDEPYYSYLTWFKYLPDTYPERHPDYNVINRHGHNTTVTGAGNNWFLHQFHETGHYRNWPKGLLPENLVVNVIYHWVPWYNAKALNDPYQELPEKYNIDSGSGYGMYFVKPKQGEMINIPIKNQAFKDTLELEIIVPQFYQPDEGLMEMLYEIKGELGKVIWPNFVIRLYSNNVYQIWGSKRPNDESQWILQHDIEFVQGYYDEDGYMYAAKFKAELPIVHKVPIDEGSSLIVADLYIDYSNNNLNDRQVVRLENARTWVRYLTYYGVVDEDGDGIDDRTGQPVYDYGTSPIDEHGLEKPDIDDYESNILGRLSYYWDSLVYYVQLPFYYIRVGIQGIIDWITNIGTFIDSFTSIFDRLFSFLPAEVTAMLALGFSTLMIITIVRAIRGS